MKRLVLLIKTILVFAGIWISVAIALPLGFIFFILSLIGFDRFARWLLRGLARLWARAVIWATGCKVTVEGLEHIPREGEGLCFVGNHPGDFDVILALAYIPRAFGFIAKKEILFFPFINLWVLLLGGLFLDRKNIGQARRAIEGGAERIRRGLSMIIFPEGTRSRGKGLLPFKAGAFKLATLAGSPIIPMAIEGSYAVYEETGFVRAVPVRLAFGPPISTKNLSVEERKALPEQVREEIARMLSGDSTKEG